MRAKGADEPIDRGHHLTGEIEPGQRLFSVPEPFGKLAFDGKGRRRRRQGKRDESSDFFPASRGALVSTGGSLGHDLHYVAGHARGWLNPGLCPEYADKGRES